METLACQILPTADGPVAYPKSSSQPWRWQLMRRLGACALGLSVLSMLLPMGVLGMAGRAIAQASVLDLGSSGPQVSAVQTDLACLGYPVAADGIYGEDTVAKVEQFQQNKNLLVDGQVGPATLQALSAARQAQGGCQQSTAISSASTFPSPTGDYSTNSTTNSAILQRGDTGGNVRLLQQRLCSSRYNCAVTNVFDYSTEQAVIQFQRDNRLDPDGIVGPKTWAALNVKPVAVRQYVVLIPMDTRTTLPQVQQVVRDASIDRTSGLGPFIRAGSYSNRKDAEYMAGLLRLHHFDAQVRRF